MISISLWTRLSPVHQAPYAVMTLDQILSKTQHTPIVTYPQYIHMCSVQRCVCARTVSLCIYLYCPDCTHCTSQSINAVAVLGLTHICHVTFNHYNGIVMWWSVYMCSGHNPPICLSMHPTHELCNVSLQCRKRRWISSTTPLDWAVLLFTLQISMVAVGLAT